ncbi:hypothetical protein [Methanogenium cariaci]|jgi:hypothetical protein
MGSNSAISWNQYQLLENEFLNYLRYVPLTPTHYDVWSYQLGSMLLDIGSIVDSFLKSSITSSEFNSIPNISKYRQKKQDKKLNMNDYREVYDKFYVLSSKYVYNLKNNEKIYPFKDWNLGKSPEWWKDHTDVKHDRFQNKEKATLKSTFHALGGLFLLNVTNNNVFPYLVDIDVIGRMGNPKWHVKSLADNDQISVSERTIDPIYVKTEIFGYVYSNKINPHPSDVEIGVLSPANQGFYKSWER